MGVSSYGSPRHGGYASRVVTVEEDGHPVHDDQQPQGHEGATNQEMELLAPTAASWRSMSALACSFSAWSAHSSHPIRSWLLVATWRTSMAPLAVLEHSGLEHSGDSSSDR